ncbi:hypothetical protein D8674_035210 [Pyrus ussuriensis x Pyrus communis]|uniref:Uncharacterized protein n=1 Tax=Pyrus ussuriensis x Pyrus communis TaxID=2448454 RepID=A0A5N5GQ60_9ROSA|nr:hypothetical protein D8674_035210 [Pyrus ussuriensis x Pyrus communis]
MDRVTSMKTPWQQIQVNLGTSLYGGPLEFLFIVESTENPAYRAVSMALSKLRYKDHSRSEIHRRKVHHQSLGYHILPS